MAATLNALGLLTQDPHRYIAVVRGPVAQLAELVVSPAIHRAGGGDPAGMLAPGTDGGEGQPPGDGRGGCLAGGGPIAQRTLAVVAPAVGPSRFDDSSGVIAAEADRGEDDVA